jgi:hypothetical protein
VHDRALDLQLVVDLLVAQRRDEEAPARPLLRHRLARNRSDAPFQSRPSRAETPEASRASGRRSWIVGGRYVSDTMTDAQTMTDRGGSGLVLDQLIARFREQNPGFLIGDDVIRRYHLAIQTRGS